MTLRARFVDSISATPTVRLDLVAAPWRLQKSSRFDPPQAKRARVSTLLTDGATYPASAYDDRVLELHLLMENASTDDAAAAIQTLARELDRPAGNFFEYRLPNQTNSVFFRTVRLAMESVDIVTEGRDQFIAAPVIAEPFGYGLPEDPVVDAVVSTDPAAGSNGCFVDVTGVKGDVESPALIEWPGSTVTALIHTVIAPRRRGTPSNAPFLIQAESMTQGTDTTTQPNDVDMSGAGNNFSRCTFTTATMQTRLSVTTVGTAGVDLRGRYRVFVRYRRSSATGTINLQLQWGISGGFVINDAVEARGSLPHAANLGLINIPQGIDPVNGADGTELGVSNALELRLQAERTSGTSTIDFDFLVLVPADDRFAAVGFNASSVPGLDHYTLDASDNNPVAYDASGQVISVESPSVEGGLPLLSPNQANRIYILRNVSPNVGWTLTTVSPVSVRYMPRYLSVRPAST